MDQQGSEPMFSAVSEVDGDKLSVRVSGEVDMATADRLYATATGPKATFLTLDLRPVSFFDSAAIHALVRIAEHYAGRLSVLPSRQVRRVLEISGLGDQPWLTPA
ncbi:STAS domain-containing protein [Catenuloplanes atrovinosus]|uniref:Anti-anti-sigma factor n=1 Tax=Catenuloplanes atrovinosus TaxID=137266 RepID=A0AAE3YK82_9ACTN|nr:STAS domain-containing protein [Catenuloplanes atrovinosus]MDR7273381.1 anti-anti-sigma factor [Catenuloplanes atrovinosus]